MAFEKPLTSLNIKRLMLAQRAYAATEINTALNESDHPQSHFMPRSQNFSKSGKITWKMAALLSYV
jgi:hypothetical protein